MAGPATLAPPMLDGTGDPGQATVRAVVATLGKIDGDGDVTLPGYFGRQDVVMLPTHDWSHVPLGKVVMFEDGDQAIADLKVNLAIPAARAWFEALRFDLANPPSLAAWSYGYTVKAGGSWEGKFAGRDVRFLQPLPDGSPGGIVHEVSPVVEAAGVGTGTLEVGSDGTDELTREYLRFVRSQLGDTDAGDDLAREYARFVR